MVQISKQLVVRKEIPLDNSTDLVNSLDVALADYHCQKKEYEKGLKIYREVLPMLTDHERGAAVNKYINYALEYAGSMAVNKKWPEAIEIYRDLMKYRGFPVTIYKNIGLCMKAIGNADLAIKFLKRFEEISPDKEDVYVYLADITYSDIKDNIKAIEYYEKALEKNQNNFSIYNMLGHLYSTCYQDKYKDKQIYYLTKAFELAQKYKLAYFDASGDEELHLPDGRHILVSGRQLIDDADVGNTQKENKSSFGLYAGILLLLILSAIYFFVKR